LTLARNQFVGNLRQVDIAKRPSKSVQQDFQERKKSSQLSPHDRFVIALHSSEVVIETGLLGCLTEKMAATLAINNY
jgi:hypothetical protein